MYLLEHGFSCTGSGSEVHTFEARRLDTGCVCEIVWRWVDAVGVEVRADESALRDGYASVERIEGSPATAGTREKCRE